MSMRKLMEIINSDRVWLVIMWLTALAALGLALGIIPDGARHVH